MRMRILLICILLFCVGIHIGFPQVPDHEASLDSATLEKTITRANNLINSFKNDSAYNLLSPILERLIKERRADSPMGLKVQLAAATALEHDDQDSLAMPLLLKIREISEKKALWETYAKACIALANLHETLNQKGESLEDLRRAQSILKQNDLENLYPGFAVRMASWHRVFGDRDSALFYAQEVLRTAPAFNQILEEAIGHMLMNLLIADSSSTEALEHCFAAIKIYQQLEDYTGCSAMFNGVAKLHFRGGAFPKALHYNDSIIFYSQKSINQGYERDASLFEAYKFRADIYRELRQMDSAWFYLKKGSELEKAFLESRESEKVIEIEARYDDEKNAQRIATQARIIQMGKSRRNFLMTIFVIVLMLVIALLYFYLHARNANRKISKQAEQLKNLDKAKSRFFANVSHELRTPLTLILGPIHTLLKDNNLSTKQAELLQMASHSGKQLQNLVNEILNLRKLEMGKMELMETATELSLFFQSHLAQFESKAQMQDIHFQFETGIEREVVAAIDQEKCRQILYNLLGNAFKFTSEGGTIKGKVEILEQKLYLEVEDSGRGIHPEDLPHIFERFFQSRQPDKPAEGGTGIGLAICHEYVQLLGGEIQAESELGKGTIFRLSFPVNLLEKADIPEIHSEEVYDSFPIVEPVFSSNPEEKSNSSTPRILVVEDNPNLQQYLQLILSDRFNVTTASHGKAALELLDNPNDFQLIISDLMMPVMDGYQLLEKLKSRDDTRQIPVIMLTARAEMSDKLKALRIGVDDYLKKPFNEEELITRIENLLKNQQVRQTEGESLPEKRQKVPAISQEDQEWLESFEEYVKKHFADDLLSVPDLALTFAMSESTLLRQLKRLTGLTPVQYLKEVRLNEAYQLLETRAFNSVSQVAQKVGYADARSFSRSFRKRFGVSPSEVLKK